MTPADLQIPPRGSAPVEDPAVVAGKEAQEAAAAWSVYAKAHPTFADEQTPEYKAIKERSETADDAFADAPVASMAGVLTKMRALEKDLIEDQGKSWAVQHVKTAAAFLEGFAGAPSVVDDDHPDAALLALWQEWVPFMDRLNDPRTPEDEGNTLGEQTWEIERRIIDTTPQTPVGLMALVKLLARYQEIGPSFTDQRERDLGRNILATLERLTPGLVEIGWGPSIVIDPAVAALAEYRVAKAAEDAFSDDEATAETPEYIAAGDRRYALGDAVIDAVPTSLAGVGAKVRFVFDYWERGNDLWPAFDEMAKSMFPFLEGGAAAAPDPIVALWAEWGAINEEVIAHLAAIPEGAGTNMGKTGHVPGKPGVAPEEKEWDDALDRRDAVEQKILETPATSMRGVAVKIRLVTHCTDITDLTKLYATPAREIDYEKECIVLECEVKAAVSALIDAERLAGVS